MSYSLRANVGMTTASGTSVTPASLPAGWQVGDLLLGLTTTNAATGGPTPTDPAGWTRLIVPVNSPALMLYGRIAQAGDTAPTFTWNLGATAADIAAFSGTVYTDLSTIRDKYTDRATTSTTVIALNGGSLVPAVDNELVILAGRRRASISANTFGAAPAGFTKFTGPASANGQDVVWMYQLQTTATTIAATQAVTVGTAEASDNTQGFGVVLKQGTSGPPIGSRMLLGVGI